MASSHYAVFSSGGRVTPPNLSKNRLSSTSRRVDVWSPKAEHQPRLVADPVGIQFGHCIVEFVVAGCRLLESAEIAEVLFRRFDDRRGVRRACLLVARYGDLR